jgi:futalosine hydrolase
MKLLIVAATKEELTGFYQHHNLSGETFVQTSKFDVLITGVGMTATAFALGKYLSNTYQLVLNIGVAGSFDPSIKLGSLVQVSTDVFAELGAEDHDEFLTIDKLGFGINKYSATAEVSAIPKVRAITVNKVHGNELSITKIKSLFDAQIESMEGAAVFYAASKESIPSLQVRSISNYIEPRNRENWNIGLAIKNLNDWLIHFVDDYTDLG